MFNLLKLLPLLLYLYSNTLNADAEIVVGNLLVGREERLFASSTCGLKSVERYCIPSDSGERTKCFQCDSRLETLNKQSNHHVSNVVRETIPGTKQTSWWQSKNGEEDVHLQLNLEAKFQIIDLNMTFKEPTPAAMLVELSDDFGKNWRITSYFADDCSASCPLAAACQPISTKLSCPMATVATNLRVNFTQFREVENDEGKYYAVSGIIVRGTCHCYQNSNECNQLSGTFVEGMVGAGCNCVRNTTGLNCERCKEGFRTLISPNSNERFDCVACDCDPIGSLGPNCNPVDGHCQCLPSFRGQKCEVKS